MSLLFNTLYRFVSVSFKEQVSFNFMAAVTTCNDFGAQENKICLLIVYIYLIPNFPLYPLSYFEST